MGVYRHLAYDQWLKWTAARAIDPSIEPTTDTEWATANGVSTRTLRRWKKSKMTAVRLRTIAFNLIKPPEPLWDAFDWIL